MGRYLFPSPEKDGPKIFRLTSARMDRDQSFSLRTGLANAEMRHDKRADAGGQSDQVGSPMTELDKRPVTMQELLVSSPTQTDGLAKLLIKSRFE